MHQSLGEAQMLIAAIGGVASRQCHFTGQTLALSGFTHSRRRFVGTPALVQQRRRPRLPGRSGGFDPLQAGNQIDEIPLVGRGIHRDQIP